jgi:NAD(P)-dependent dehydrogenase (short-subunit alcohol dehydrogenase family)
MDGQASRIALVTGAGSGIGEAVARTLLKAGWTVALTGRRRARLDAVVAQADPGGERTLAHAADVADPASVAALFEAIEARYGRLDLLFNNAGFGIRPASVEDVPLEQWRAVLDTNLTGAFLCLQHAFRMMKAQTPKGGRIINNGSISAQSPRFGTAAYTASKHGLMGLTRAAALDGRDHNIAVGQIDVGSTETPPMQPVTEPKMDVQNVADAVAYMASLPVESNVLSMTVLPTVMPFVGRARARFNSLSAF